MVNPYYPNGQTQAIKDALMIIGDGPCSDTLENCKGCSVEWMEAVDILNMALGKESHWEEV